eukprot:GHVO01058003.1.p1 GENE.GHVO01058003.1~~GHVO01058003.1.p1  ORF type:complete len:185 (+),score=31.10 GHVO01058003.1:36-590(+)
MTDSNLPPEIGDPYHMLGVDESVDKKGLKKAFRRRALVLHPDKNPNDKKADEKFHALQIAFEFLCDPKKRATFDFHKKVDAERRKRRDKLTVHKKKLADKLEHDEQNVRPEPSASDTARAKQATMEDLKKAKKRRVVMPSYTPPPNNESVTKDFKVFESSTMTRLREAAAKQKQRKAEGEAESL